MCMLLPSSFSMSGEIKLWWEEFGEKKEIRFIIQQTKRGKVDYNLKGPDGAVKSKNIYITKRDS